MRNAESGRCLPFHIPRSAFALLLAACTPITSRPDFRPLPQALTLLLVARPQQIIPVLAALVAAESLRVRRASPRDGYLETEWYHARTHRSFADGHHIPDLAHTVKLRCWADPYVPGETILTLEVAYRPREDPSRTDRDLEAPAPKEEDGHKIAERLLAKLKARFGSP